MRDSTFATHENRCTARRECRVCGNPNSIYRSYGLMICRRCFRENAAKIGFKKYN